MPDTPLVTVLLPVYNQERTIARAIDSVLAQKTDFPFELVLCDDYSHDGTRAILLRYAARFPRLIRLELHPRHLGLSRSWYEGLCSARGEFVCILDGCDQWTSPVKLQTQVNFLRSHPDYLAVGHPVALTDRNGSFCGVLPASPALPGRELTLPLFLRGVSWRCTSCLMRRFVGAGDQQLECYLTANQNQADFALSMLLLDRGRIFLLEDRLSTRRIPDPVRSDVKRYADFLDAVAASREYFGAKYDFTGCLLSGSFRPFLGRIRQGGMAAFLKQLRRLPLRVRLAFAGYVPVRLAALALHKIKRSPAHE